MITKENVLNISSKFIELAKIDSNNSAIEKIQNELDKFRAGLFRIVVVGEIKKGKSSFINALLGTRDLLPALSDVATSTVFKIMYGQGKKIKVFKLPDDPENPETVPPPLEISETELHRYGTEDGNPNNEKRVDFIGIQYPHPLLRSGVVIIDTPGLGGLFRKHREITWAYIPNADAVFFILESVESVATKDEMECLEKLRKLSPAIFFVQTKIDLVEESQWKKWKERNLQIISEKLNIPVKKLIYFPVSSKLKFVADENHSSKHLDRSGYSALLYLLHNRLIPNKEKHLGRRVIHKLALETNSIQAQANEHIRILKTETKEGLDTLEKEYKETKEKYEQWVLADYQQSLEEFNDKFTDLRRKTRDVFIDELDPSPHAPIVSEFIDVLRRDEIHHQDIVDNIDVISSDCIDKCSFIVRDIQENYNKAVGIIVEELAHKINKTLPIFVSSSENELQINTLTSIHLKNDSIDKGFNLYYKGMAGLTMGGIGGGLLLAIVPPLGIAAVIAGSLLGVGFGVKMARQSFSSKQKDEVIRQVQGLLTDIVRKAQTKGIRQFDRSTSEMEKSIRKELDKSVSEIKTEITEKLISISEMRNKTKKEIRQKLDNLNNIKKQANNVMSTIISITDTKNQL